MLTDTTGRQWRTHAEPAARDERRWDRGSWAVLALALLVLCLVFIPSALSWSVPGDGWVLNGDRRADPPQEYFEFNLNEGPTPIHQGDELLTVEGLSVEEIVARQFKFFQVRAPDWGNGTILRYTVRRDGQVLALDVPQRVFSPWQLLAAQSRILPGTALVQRLASPFFLIVGLLVFFLRPRHRAAHALLILGVAFLFQIVPSFYWVSTHFYPFPPPSIPVDVWTLAINPSIMYMALAFPAPKLPIRKSPRLTIAFLYLSAPLALNTVYLLNLDYPAGYFNAANFVYVSQILLVFVITFGSLIHSALTVREPVVRSQLKWVALGLMSFIVPGIGGWLLGYLGFISEWLSLLSVTGWFVFPVSLAIAILRYRLFDIDLVLNRALVYGSLTALVVAGYVLLVTALSALFRATDNLLPSLMATGLIAVLFQPLRYQLQRGVNRLMYGERDEPYAALVRLGQRLEAAFEPSAVLPSIVETVAKTLNLPYVAIATAEQGELSIKSEWHSADATAATLNVSLITIPLIHHHEQLGEMRVCPRRGETTLAEADRRLLADLAQQASVAVHGARLMNDLRDLTTDLQRSRERLVLAREEERRRLRRNLHDDLAPILAGLALTADTVADLIPTDPAKATALANDLNHSLRAAVSDIRRLVDDLRPPTLDELGLVAAIRERAAQFTHAADGLRVTVEADELPPLPAAVEVAAYRIAQEALMNVARHAQAKACHIRLALDDDCLHLEITDDGLGLTEPRTPGVGLHSMQERSAELGGTCVITAARDGGTKVLARLPVIRET